MASETGLLSPELCFLDWDVESVEELFDRLGTELTRRGLVGEGWRAAIAERERAFPTGLRTPCATIAIPHVDPVHIRRPYIALVRPQRPVTFQPMAGVGDEVPATFVVNLGIMREGGQVEALQAIMGIFTDAEHTARVMAQATPEATVETLRELRGLVL